MNYRQRRRARAEVRKNAIYAGFGDRQRLARGLHGFDLKMGRRQAMTEAKSCRVKF
jgi:hypothetical protein